MLKINIHSFEVKDLSDLSYSTDQFIFEELENGKKRYMDAFTHRQIWHDIMLYYPELSGGTLAHTFDKKHER